MAGVLSRFAFATATTIYTAAENNPKQRKHCKKNNPKQRKHCKKKTTLNNENTVKKKQP